MAFLLCSEHKGYRRMSRSSLRAGLPVLTAFLVRNPPQSTEQLAAQGLTTAQGRIARFTSKCWINDHKPT
jgi:hypothetical protein